MSHSTAKGKSAKRLRLLFHCRAASFASLGWRHKKAEWKRASHSAGGWTIKVVLHHEVSADKEADYAEEGEQSQCGGLRDYIAWVGV